MIENHHLRGRRGLLLLAAAFAAWAAWGCGGANNPPKPDIEKSPWEVRVESPLDTTAVTVPPQGSGDEVGQVLDAPPALETPQVVETQPSVTPAAPGPAMTPSGSAAPASAPAVSTPGDTYMPGWRIQVFASSSMARADEFSRKARQRFTEAVYVEYDPPLYKVRVGDFLSKEDARHMANRAKAEGFDAWIVEALVLRPDR
jgi:cell division septation protein DedD